MRAFDYTAAKAAAALAGLQWSDEVEAQVDAEFVALTLTQAQVDRLITLYIHYFTWATSTKHLSFWRRAVFAFLIMKGGR